MGSQSVYYPYFIGHEGGSWVVCISIALFLYDGDGRSAKHRPLLQTDAPDGAITLPTESPPATLCTISLTFKNSTLFPTRTITYCVWFSERMAITSL